MSHSLKSAASIDLKEQQGRASLPSVADRAVQLVKHRRAVLVERVDDENQTLLPDNLTFSVFSLRHTIRVATGAKGEGITEIIKVNFYGL